MVNESDPQKCNKSRELSTGILITVFLGMSFVSAVTGATSGALGVYISWALTFAVTFAMCIVMSRKFSNPFMPAFCGLLTGNLCVGTPAEQFIGNFAAEGLVKPIALITSSVAIVLWAKIFHVIASRRNAQG